MRSFASAKALEQIDFVCRRYGWLPSAYMRDLGADVYTDVTTYADGSQVETEHRLFDNAHMAFCFDEACALAGVLAEKRIRQEAADSAAMGSNLGDPAEKGTGRTRPVYAPRPGDATIFETPYGEIGIKGTIPFIGKRS